MENRYEELKSQLDRLEELVSRLGKCAPVTNFKLNEWMTLSEGAKYAGVSINTFAKFRLMGLKVVEIEGIKRVSRKEIDNFLEQNSF